MLFKSTKNFFKNTLQTFKSLLSGGGYERLPKNPHPFNPFSCTTGAGDSKRHLDTFYLELTNEWRSEADNTNAKTKTNMNKQDRQGVCEGILVSSKKDCPLKRSDDGTNKKRKQEIAERSPCKVKAEGFYDQVIQRFKELESMDATNSGHALDMGEAFRYYSRLTIPAYRDIVDKFFVQLYSEFLDSSSNPQCVPQ